MSISLNNYKNKTVNQATQRFTMDFDCDKARIAQHLSSRVGALPVVAQLVPQKDIRASHVYKRFNGVEKKNDYRVQLLEALEQSWTAQLGPEKAQEMGQRFVELATHLDDNGAVIFAAILSSENFQKLIDAYTEVLSKSGSKTWIHAYVNLANHPDFLTNKGFNGAFMHPLLIALVSYRVGGPVRIVDARGKDAEPIEVLAQDNMLHIDNTPFNDEYKIILAWERGKPSGPKGQNFVFLPGTHKGARQCMEGKEGPWSSENASIFITQESVEQVLTFQEKIIGKRAVVELTHDTKPLTTLFAAGSLVHHRHRTEEGLARSCMILAFHRAEDNPGQLVAPKHLETTPAKTDALYQSLFGYHGVGSQDKFITALVEKTEEMADLIVRISTGKATEEIVPQARELKGAQVEKWRKVCTKAPTVEEKKAQAKVTTIGAVFDTREDFVKQVGKMMAYDKHGPLDLILYPDAHEEIRKWARNQIREKKIDVLNSELLGTWAEVITSLKEDDLLSAQQLQTIANTLAGRAEEKIKAGIKEAILRENEKISPLDAYRSVHQLLLNLGESIVRCEDKTAFLSTSLFIFWAADTLMRFGAHHDQDIKTLGTQLLKNYIATAILVEKQ